MIEPTDEMVQLIYERIDFWNHGDDGIREGLAAVFALVERDYRVEPRPPWERTVHQAVCGDSHVHCCGKPIGTLPTGERWTYDPHGATCRGPS